MTAKTTSGTSTIYE